MTIQHANLHPHAIHAAWAARNERTIGRYAAWRYCQLRGVPSSIYTLARVLACAERAGIK